MPDLETLQSRLGYTFRDVSLLQLALTHPSIAHEQGSPLVQHNQRLEFLGDSVLGLALTRELYLKFSNVGEGALTKARAQMVNRKTLAEQGRLLELGEYLVLSRGEEANGGRTRESALADAFEAVLGAMFLDGGFDVAQGIILQCFRDGFGELTEIPSLENPKGELQEVLQADSFEAPIYELVASTGPDHDRVFECIVRHGGNELGRGTGKSKKAAESEAATAALKAFKQKTPLPAAGASTEEPQKD